MRLLVRSHINNLSPRRCAHFLPLCFSKKAIAWAREMGRSFSQEWQSRASRSLAAANAHEVKLETLQPPLQYSSPSVSSWTNYSPPPSNGSTLSIFQFPTLWLARKTRACAAQFPQRGRDARATAIHAQAGTTTNPTRRAFRARQVVWRVYAHKVAPFFASRQRRSIDGRGTDERNFACADLVGAVRSLGRAYNKEAFFKRPRRARSHALRTKEHSALARALTRKKTRRVYARRR